MEYTQNRDRLLMGATIASMVLFAISVWMSFSYVGTEVTQGNVQRLFYIHLGSFFGAFFLFFAALIAGAQYLRTRADKWDALGLASIEIGIPFALVNIVTGAIWARPIWGTYWTWDPRLTSATIMVLTYAAYLMLRGGIDDPDRRKRFAAVYGMIAFISVILTVVIIRVRPDTIHPVVAGPTTTNPDIEGDFDLSRRITETVLFSVFTYSVIAATLVWHRIRLQNRIDAIEARKMKLLLES